MKISTANKIQRLIDCILRAATGDNTAFYDIGSDGDEIDAIGVAFNSLLEETRNNTDEQQRRFIAADRALQRVRGPLAALQLLMASLTEARKSGPVQDELITGALNTVASTCRMLLARIDEASATGLGLRVSDEKINISELVGEVLGSVPHPADYRVTVHIPHYLVLCTDRTVFRSVVRNLIENAFGFRRTGISGSLEIKARRLPGKLVMQFSDNGIGIERENVSRIFQVHSPVAENNGLIGIDYRLYSVRRDIEALGGDLHLTGMFRQGLTIELCFPISVENQILRNNLGAV